jgi:sec-independent protein translocase protein TatC
MVFIMGLVFELPLLAWLLSKIGVLNREFLQRYRKHAVVILMILAALITPTGDPITLSLVFLPLYLLYEISIRVVKNS